MARDKLGLALSGGGFRASLFHAGVLRRMAELDLLRYVEVLSTVSGGSIVGALYLLLLKERLEAPALASQGPQELALTRDQYVEMVDELQRALVDGVRRNLRTRLLMNPFVLLHVMLFGGTLGTAMATLYEKHFFAAVVRRLRQREAAAAESAVPRVRDAAPDRAGCLSIRAMRLRREQVLAAGGSEDYNHRALNADHDSQRGGPGSAVTRLILNATSLNSGARFWFSHAEIGDWYLGHIRYDEIAGLLLPRKILLEMEPSALRALDDSLRVADPGRSRATWDAAASRVTAGWGLGHSSGVSPPAGPPQAPARRLALWWLEGRQGSPADAAQPTIPWNRLEGWRGFDLRRFAERLARADAGLLREAEAFAWYLCVGRGRNPRVSAGFDDEALRSHLWDALESIDEAGADRLRTSLADPAHAAERGVLEDGLWALVLEVYYLRVAESMSPTVKAEWDRLPLSHAVAASAAFPPVFPPFQLRSLYDDLHVRTLGLTDGGVFDNLGTTALLDEHCNWIVVSDAGGIFETRQRRSSVGRLGLSGRLMQILGERPISLYRHDLRERRRMGRAASLVTGVPDAAAKFVALRGVKGLASFRIDSERLTLQPVPEAPREAIARLRTDLDAFGDIEIKALVNEGYVLADQYLRRELAGSPFDPATRPRAAAPPTPWQPVLEVPLPLGASAERVQQILKAGQSRFLRALRVKAPLSVAATLLTCLAVTALIWLRGWDWAGLNAGLAASGAQIAAWAGQGAIGLIPPLFLIPLLQWIALRWVAVVLVAGLVVWIVTPDSASGRLAGGALLGRQSRSRWRTLATIAKTLQHRKSWLVLLAVPAVVLVVPAVAVLGHVLFARPFLGRASDPDGLH